MTATRWVAVMAGAGFVLSGGLVRSVSALPDPCAVLTTAQVSDALGVTVADGKHLATTLCQWAPTGTSTAQNKQAQGKQVTVTFQDKRAFDYAKMPVPDASITKTPVTGIGDEAVFGTTKGIVTVLNVRKGDVMFTVRVTGLPDDQAQIKEKALALLILQKL